MCMCVNSTYNYAILFLDSICLLPPFHILCVVRVCSERRAWNRLNNAIQKMPGVPCSVPSRLFYVFVVVIVVASSFCPTTGILASFVFIHTFLPALNVCPRYRTVYCILCSLFIALHRVASHRVCVYTFNALH